MQECAALTMTVAVHPQKAAAATVTLKSVSMKQFRMKPGKTKAKKVKRGNNTVIFNSYTMDGKTTKWHFMVFTAPKKKTYTFTFSELHEVEVTDDIVSGSVSAYTVKRSQLWGTRLRTGNGKKYTLYLDSPVEYAVEPSTGFFSVKLKKGQKIYFSVGAASGSAHCRINVNIK